MCSGDTLTDTSYLDVLKLTQIEVQHSLSHHLNDKIRVGSAHDPEKASFAGMALHEKGRLDEDNSATLTWTHLEYKNSCCCWLASLIGQETKFHWAIDLCC